jgi:ribose-phosphate pyrophosphokinase
VISSGGTLRILANLLRERHAASLEAYATHALLSPQDEEALKEAGFGSIFSCNSVPHTTNAIHLVSDTCK